MNKEMERPEIYNYLLLNRFNLECNKLHLVHSFLVQNKDALFNDEQQKEFNLLANQIEELLPNDNNLVKIKITYPGPQTANYDDLHPAAKTLFWAADEAYYNATNGEHLHIESGLRTVYRQAELYVCWRLGEQGCNPANIPGASVHNYGFAIDIQKARNAQVIRALDNNGWDRTVMPKEPWHWETVGIEEHTQALQRQKEMRAQGSIARKWQAEWETARRENDSRNNKIEEYNQRLAVWQPKWNQLQRDIDSFSSQVDRHNSRIEQWNRDREAFSNRVDSYNSEVEALERLRNEINNMPAGEERDRLIREYNSRATRAQEERASLEQIQAELNERAEQLRVERNDIEAREQELLQRKGTLEAEANALLAMRDEIERLEQSINNHMQNSRRLLEQIASVVHPSNVVATA